AASQSARTRSPAAGATGHPTPVRSCGRACPPVRSGPSAPAPPVPTRGWPAPRRARIAARSPASSATCRTGSRKTGTPAAGLGRAAPPHHPDEVTSVGRDGASDAVSFLRAGVPAVEFGPIGAGHHGPDEWVSISSLGAYRRTITDFVSNLPNWLTEDRDSAR